MRCLVFTPLLLLSCGPEKKTILEECLENPDYGHWGDDTNAMHYGYLRDITESNMKAVSFHIHGVDTGTVTWRLAARFELHNYAETDCPMLIYRSDAPPNFDLITAASAETVPLENDDNLGVLQYAVNMAPSEDTVSTSFEGQAWGKAMDFYLTLVTCAEPMVYEPSGDFWNSSYYQFEFIGCDETYDEDEDEEVIVYDEESRTPDGFFVDILVPEG